LAAAAGIHTGLFRPPYSSEPDAVTPAELAAWRAIARKGYLVVLANRDTGDWRRPGVSNIVAAATPVTGRGNIILFHDGGGDRSQTVAAVDQVVTALQARSYEFRTVSGLAGLNHDQVNHPVGSGQRIQGEIVAEAFRFGDIAGAALRLALVAMIILSLLRAAALLLFARRHASRPEQGSTTPMFAPPVSIVVPAYNEEVGIEASITSLIGSHYPRVEVVVVDDGSSDRTAEILAGLDHPNLVVIHQANAGKAGALNVGIQAAAHDVIVTVDADTVFEPDTLAWLVQPFENPAVGAVSGNTKVANRDRLLGRWQHIEYVMGFNLDRRMFDVLGCMPTVPGAIGAFRRAVITRVGGVPGDTLAEDTDLTMAIVRSGWKVVYQPRARAWTEAPSGLSPLWKQRYRWSYGTMQAIWKHRRALREPGPLGRRALPYLLLFQIVLPLLAPAVDLFTLLGLVFLQPLPLLGFWVGLNLLSLALAGYAFRLDGESPGVLWALVVQQFVYRQLMYLVVIQSAVTALLGTTLRWQKLERSGHTNMATALAGPAFAMADERSSGRVQR
jgi:poly-beta-1,6 N-acetyl-D-glucosamine synthase